MILDKSQIRLVRTPYALTKKYPYAISDIGVGGGTP